MICEALTGCLSMKDVTPGAVTIPTENMMTPSSFSYSFYNFESSAAAYALTLPDLVVAFSNAVWYHSSLGRLSLVPMYVAPHQFNAFICLILCLSLCVYFLVVFTLS